MFGRSDSRIFKQSHLEKTHHFFQKYGGKTIIIARFVPIVRTFAPFVAGMGRMHYYTFIIYNVIGGFVWVVLFCMSGYFFGNIPFVQHNLEILLVSIILISLFPALLEFIRIRIKNKHNNA
jgi:membrane-associated protein